MLVQDAVASEEWAEDPCGHTLETGRSVSMCMRRRGHPDEHIGMFGSVEWTVVQHWGNADEMANHLLEVMGAKGVG